MARPDFFDNKRLRRRGMGQFLLDGERIVTAAHQHWAKVVGPIASVVAGFVLVLTSDSLLPASLGVLANVLWWAWFVLVGRATWKVLMWRKNWFVATDKRLLLTYGLINQRIAMMSLSKVVDMSYNRSPLGRLLGYGTFVRESAGQNQSLHKVEWVADPDRTYRAICAEIFGLDDHGLGLDTDDQHPESDPPARTPNRYAGFVPAPHGPGATEHSTGIRTRPAESQHDDSDSWHPDTNLPDSDIHEADTGPIPY
jgi:Bacterial PH domain